MILLEKYIKEFLKEATSSIINPASDISGMTQHQQAASYNMDMTNLDNKTVLLKVLENVGDNCFISFVDEYDEKIPRLEISPNVSYDTPHGNYAYPLNISSLKDIIEYGEIGGTSFALDRPYFHIFKKSDGVKSIEIESDGSNNYSGDFEKDLRTIVHTYIMFLAARKLEQSKSIDISADKAESDYEKNKRIKRINRVIERNKSLVVYNSSISFDNSGSFGKILNELIKDLCIITRHSNNRFPAAVTKKIVDYISKLTQELALSARNRFFKVKEKKALSDFHTLYFACWMFSNMARPEFGDDNQTIQQGPVFTMLLNSIDLDFINDKGSSTLHDNEPIQAVYLNSSKKENVSLIGTYNNIFESGKDTSIEDVVDVLEKNPNLSHIFNSGFFDDVKIDNTYPIFLEAHNDLTSNIDFLHCKLFDIRNDVFSLNISASLDKSNTYVCDIGFKKEFISKSVREQIDLIISNIDEINKTSSKVDYLIDFVEKYSNKNILENKYEGTAKETSKVINNIEEYFANYDNDDIRKMRYIADRFLSFAFKIEKMCNQLKFESVT